VELVFRQITVEGFGDDEVNGILPPPLGCHKINLSTDVPTVRWTGARPSLARKRDRRRSFFPSYAERYKFCASGLPTTGRGRATTG